MHEGIHVCFLFRFINNIKDVLGFTPFNKLMRKHKVLKECATNDYSLPPAAQSYSAEQMLLVLFSQCTLPIDII
jgi:hypothetical protein